MITIQIDKDHDGWVSRAIYNGEVLNVESFDYQKTKETSIDKILDEVEIHLDKLK